MPVLSYTLRTLALLVATTLSSAWHAHAADLVAYTEEWAPYNFSEKGVVRGIATDILRAACSAEKLDCDIHMMPWARAYKSASNTPNTLVFTTARKPSRESEFLWVGPILPRTTWVFGRASLENSVHSVRDLASHRVGVVRDEAAQQDLEAAGLPPSALVVQPSNVDIFKMLSRSMVDAMVDTEVGMKWNLRTAAIAPDTVRKLVKLSDAGAYYFAMNLDSNPALVRNLQKAIDHLRQSGKLDAIVREYMENRP